MKKAYLIIFLTFSLKAQDNERVIGHLVNYLDRKTMRKIEKPTDVQKNELVAACKYQYANSKWVYAEVIDEPDHNFHGFVSFENGPCPWKIAINFKSEIRKLLPKEELGTQEGNCQLQ